MKPKDLTGKKFGRWTVLEIGTKKNNHIRWLCKCDCGTIRLVVAESLVRGLSKSCGCAGRLHLEGQRFGNLLVLNQCKSTSNRTEWLCRCDCGGTKVVQGRQLKRKEVRSCGCTHRTKFWQLSSIERNKIRVINRLRREKNYTSTEWRILFDKDFEYVLRVVGNFIGANKWRDTIVNNNDIKQTMELIFFEQYYKFKNNIDVTEFPPSRKYFYKASIKRVEDLCRSRKEYWYCSKDITSDRKVL